MVEFASDFTRQEVMACAGSRTMADGEKVLVGIGLPQVACILAKYTHAPNLIMALEIGVMEPKPIHPTVGIADPRMWYQATSYTSFLGSMGQGLHRGKMDVGFISGLEIDQYGNLNSSVIGTYDNAKRRFTGSGGANDIASRCERYEIIIRHEKRKFNPKVSFITSPGHLDGPGAREEAGLVGNGPEYVITDMAVMDFEPKTKQMRLVSTHPGVSTEDVQNATGFELVIPQKVGETTVPTTEEQRLIREVIDTSGRSTLWKEPKFEWWGKV